MPILTAADYDAVRAAIDVGLTAAQVPDAVIGMPIYHGWADAQVLAAVPTAATATGTAAEWATRAAILFCAARLVRAIPNTVQESFADVTYRRDVPKAEERAAALLAEAESALATLAELEGVTPTVARPIFFTLATGRRGWSSGVRTWSG